jgi:cbb3-type cytochrome oxidase maturation protein
MAGVALAAFFVAVRHGQFDDLDTPQLRAIFDDAPEPAQGVPLTQQDSPGVHTTATG